MSPPLSHNTRADARPQTLVPGPGPAPSESTRATTWTQLGIPSVGRPVPTPSHSHRPLPAAGPTIRQVGAGGNYDSDHVHGPGPGRVIATVRVPGARRSLPPRGRVSSLTRKVDSDGGRGKGHAVPYSRYTAPDLAPSSVLFSAITRPHGVRCLTKCLAPSLYFSPSMPSAFHPCPSHACALIFARSTLAPRAPAPLSLYAGFSWAAQPAHAAPRPRP